MSTQNLYTNVQSCIVDNIQTGDTTEMYISGWTDNQNVEQP